MTPLDQAFIRAYGLNEGIPLPTIDGSIGTVPLSEAIEAQPPTPAIPSPEICREAAARARQRDVVGLPNRRAVDALADPSSALLPAPADQGTGARHVQPHNGRVSLEAPGILGEDDHVSIDQLDIPAEATTTVSDPPAVAPVPAGHEVAEPAEYLEAPIDATVIEPAETAETEEHFDPPVPCQAPESTEEPSDSETLAEPQNQSDQRPPEEAETPDPQDREDGAGPPASTVEEVAPVDEVAPEDSPAEPSVEAPGAEGPAPTEEISPPEAVAPEPPKDEPFEPLLQTDRFDWPEVCRELGRQAVEPIDRLADALVACRDQGQKVVGLGGTQRGEGCTTLVLSVARQLASRGVKVLLVDADAKQPEIARRLGLAPDADWHDVLAGRARLEDAVIESVEDQLAVLPCNRRQTVRSLSAESILDDPALLGSLRTAYDLVLVDLGPLAKTSATRRLAAGNAIDSVLLVHDVRTTPPRQLSRLKDRLDKAGTTQAGIAENFVPGTGYRVG